MDPDQTAPWEKSDQGSLFCFHDKKKSEAHFSICSRCNKQTAFSELKLLAGLVLKLSLEGAQSCLA